MSSCISVRILKENNETKVRTPARLPDAGITIEKEAAAEEAQDDFYTLNSHRFEQLTTMSNH